MLSYKFLISGFFIVAVEAQTWCGKSYMEGSPVVPPGGLFTLPGTSDEPLLNFQCSPTIKPFLEGDPISLIIDARITSLEVPGAAPLPSSKFNAKSLTVTAVLDGQTHHLGSVPLNSTGTEFQLPAGSLVARTDPYNVTCTAKVAGQTYQSTTQILYLTPPATGSVTKQDFRTGALLVKNGNSWEPILPVGFYTIFGNYLTNLSNIDEIKARGLNIIHTVPDFDAVFGNPGDLEAALDRMEELGIWLMYDMRYTYQNLTSVTEQVNMIKDRSNLLLWYTGDEPDGTSDPLNATLITKELINKLDGGGYHPVSLVLNCQDYFFTEYSAGADVLLQDTYMIGNNATFSTVWHTPCTPNFGDCGCDNCKGSFQDISDRVDDFKQRLDVLGRSRSTATWTVPQGFGGEEYWPRYPTHQEFLVQGMLGINHGALGIVSWDDPTTDDIRSANSVFAAAAPQIASFLAAPGVQVTQSLQKGVDTAHWKLPNENKSLFLVANTNYQNVSLTLGISPNNAAHTQILDGGVTSTKSTGGELVVQLNATGTGGFIFNGEISVKHITLG